MRERDSLLIVVIGLAVVLAAFGLSVLKWSTAADVATGMGTITAIVGTLVGAFFGVKVGSQGKDKAEQDRVQAIKEATAFRARLTQSQIKEALQTLE